MKHLPVAGACNLDMGRSMLGTNKQNLSWLNVTDVHKMSPRGSRAGMFSSTNLVRETLQKKL